MKQGFRLQVLVYRRSSFLKLLFLGLLFLAITHHLQPATSLAQEISPSVKKSVVKNFKADLKDYLPFGTSQNCELKSRGDANCDGSVNQFDLSIWEIEFNATPIKSGQAPIKSEQAPRRSDFNNDGLINLLDFGIWRNTFYPAAKITQAKPKFLKSVGSQASLINLIDLISKQSPMNQLGFGYFLGQLEIRVLRNYLAYSPDWIPAFARMTVLAQENPVNTQPLESSQAIISGSGNAFVVNSEGGQTQQVSFNPDGSAVSSQLFDTNGRLLANVSFLSSGQTSITTQEDGVSVQINKTAEGAVIEFFRNPDGSLIAIKSWPTQASYAKGDPPISVTIPGVDNTRSILNIQPNGDGIFETTDNYGNVLSKNQIYLDGTQISEDFKSKTIVQSNSQAGFTTLTVPNNLGGNTDYMFFEGALYAVIQTDDKNSYYIAKPLDKEGNSWNFESNVNGQKTERTISDPIKELNANTPNPRELIKYINFYKSARSNPNSITFTDGFSQTPTSIETQVKKANDILAISQTQAPAVLGIVKKVSAQANTAPPPPIKPNVPSPGDPKIFKILDTVKTTEFNSKDGWTYQWDITTFGSYSGNIQLRIPSADNKGITDPDNPVYGVIVITSGRETNEYKIPDLATLESIRNRTGAATITEAGTVSAPPPAAAAPAAAPQPAQPAQPAQPQPPQPAELSEAQKEALKNAAAVAGIAVDQLGANATAEKKGETAKNFTVTALLGSALFSPEQIRVYGDKAFVASYISDKNGFTELNESNLKTAYDNGSIEEALTALKKNYQQDKYIAPEDIYSGAKPPSSNPPSAPSVAARATTALPALGASMSFGNGMTSTITGRYEEGFLSTIKDSQGKVVATQQSNIPNARSDWTRYNPNGTSDTFTAQAGRLTAITTNVSAPGTIVGLNKDGSLVAVGDASFIGNDGWLTAGRKATDKEIAAFKAQQEEQKGATGVTQLKVEDTCFLPGTLISTPQGPAPIETLQPGDKVYSYNEDTRQKQISDFKTLDINFVDEYLIINEKIHTTIYHPFYIIDENRLITVRADELKIGDTLQTETNGFVSTYSIERITAPHTTVYNLMNVSPNNNFFAEGILVHNYDLEGLGGEALTDALVEAGVPEGINPETLRGYDDWRDSGWGPGASAASEEVNDAGPEGEAESEPDQDSGGSDSDVEIKIESSDDDT